MLTSMSHLRAARSSDGVNFAFDPAPAIFPTNPYEAYGCEDARITFIDEAYYITYTAVSAYGVAVALARTRDFESYEKLGLVFPPYQKDVAIFPAKLGGMYVCRHRPFRSSFNAAAIWTAYSPDLHCWGRHDVTVEPKAGTWQADRVGCGAAPILTPEGWLEIYHACDAEGVYRLGAMLSEPDRPEKLISRSSRCILEPVEDYELAGVYGRCVFSNGLIADDDGKLTVYYGAGDRVCAAAVATVEEMIAAAKG